ncbi:MAG: hypothetical protein KBC96_12505 [Armatimonadetes bacterium]|nr:hypothetical protein [Armatimonadota bacterium]
MLERTLTPAQRFGFGFTMLACLGWAMYCAYSAITQSSWPVFVRATFGFGSLSGLIGAAIVGKSFLRGKMHRRATPNTITGLVWVLVVFMVTLFLVFTGRQPDAAKSTYVLLTGLVFLVSAAVSLITNRIDQAQIKTEEQFLELKLRLAELAEKVER